ncbi:MAG TPA: tetratricopeptide repeat protein [Candidatus Ozemobacteraceae bacterium]|nr:tetratricopeptide repeat protein [Candidatus Ozemobacteraceae bacterium]
MDSLKLPILILVLLAGLTAFFVLQPKSPATKGPKPSSTALPTANVEELVRKANAALDRNAFDEILDLLAPVADRDEPDIQALFGYAYAGLKRFDEAAAAFEKALEKKRDTRFGYSLAYIFESMGAPDRARAMYADLTRAPLPRQVLLKVHEGLARCALLVNEPQTALESYKFLIREDPTRVEPFIGMLKLMKQAGTSKGVEKLREKGDLLHEKQFGYQFWLASLYYETSDEANALKHFRKCIQIDPANSSPYYYVYKILRRTKKLEEAVKELERFHALNPHLPYIFFQAALDAKTENRLDIAYKFLRTAVTMDRSLLGRDDNGCIAAIERHVKSRGTPEEKLFLPIFLEFVNSNFAKAGEMAGRLLPSLKDPVLKADAERLIAEVNVILGREAAYNAYLARTREAQNASLAALRTRLNTAPANPTESPEAQLDALKRKALDNPRDAKLQYSTALQLARAGDIPGAKLFLAETIKANPNIGEAYFSLGKLLHHEGNSSEALDQLRQAIRLNPSDSQARALIASIQLGNGELEQAEQEARAALLANPNNGEARLVLADTLLQAGKPEQALVEAEFGIELERDPTRRERFQALRKKLRESR